MKSITIVGGGTAGLVTALILRKSFPLYTISVIESKEIGIIGVGEGSTEHWSDFCHYCDINKPELLRETEGTLKSGIKFQNWNGDGRSYFHSISAPFWTSGELHLLPKTLISKGIRLEDVLLDTNLIMHHGGIFATNQYHFNTFKLNEFLHKKCSERNINLIDGTITDVHLSESGDITGLTDSSGVLHTADLFIDSTGFKRVLSSKLGAKWVSYKKYLPMNHALAFPTDDVSDLKHYTLSRALSSGWNWRIPTQTRYGNGYVFCDDFIDSTKAHDEVQSFYSEEVRVAKDIKFEAGRVDKFWINNCISIGLSASFVEPLEASSIGNSILQATALAQMLDYWDIDRSISEQYNSRFIGSFDNIVDFVQLHYMTKRKDTEFWRTLSERMTKTDFVEQHLETFKKTLPCKTFFGEEFSMFKHHNWMQVMAGLEMLDVNSIEQRLLKTHGEEVVSQQMEEYNNYLAEIQKSSYLEHSVLLNQNNIVLKIN
jgi:flavin-dependent dehydrogenase